MWEIFFVVLLVAAFNLVCCLNIVLEGITAGLQSGVITSTVFVHYRNYGKLNSTQ